MTEVSLLDFSDLRFAPGTLRNEVDPVHFLNPPYFFGKALIDKDDLLPEESSEDHLLDMNGLYDALSREVVLHLNRSSFLKFSLRDLSRIMSVGEAPAGELLIDSTMIEAEEVEFGVNGASYVVVHEGVTYELRAESSHMFHDIHDISCLLIFGVRESDVPKLGIFSPDYNHLGLIMEMKTYKEPRFAMYTLRSQLHKYSQEAIRLARALTFHGLIVGQESYHFTRGIPAWVLTNCARHASFIAGLIKTSREIHSDSFDSDFFQKKYTDSIVPNLPQDLLTDKSDYIYVTEETIEYCKEERVQVPDVLHKAFLKTLGKREELVSEQEFIESNIRGANRFGGRLTNIPIIRGSCVEPVGLMPRPKTPFGTFAWDLHAQAEKAGKILQTWSLPTPDASLPTFEDIRTSDSTKKLFTAEGPKRSSKARSEQIQVVLREQETHMDYLKSRGRALKCSMKSTEEKEDSKWFSLSSDFSSIKNFIDHEWFMEFGKRADEFDSLNESDNGTGAKDLWENFKRTHLFSVTDIISRIFSEVSMSVQHYMADASFEVKEVLPGLFVIISSKGFQKPIFIQVFHNDAFEPMSSNDPKRVERAGGFTYYEGFTVHPDRLSNWFNLTEKMFAISQVQCEIEKITMPELRLGGPVIARIGVILATMLEANEQTQSMLTNIRYAGMECLSGRARINPFKILKKINHFPRTLLGAWIIDNFIKSVRMMIDRRPRLEFKSSAEELQQDSLEDCICWMTMRPSKHLLVILNGWYVHSATELVNGDKFQAAAVILQKLYDAEAELRKNEKKDPEGQINCGQRDFDFERDFGVMCAFDREFVSWSCKEYKGLMMRKHPDYVNALHKRIQTSLAKITNLELCTLKSSVRVGFMEESQKGNFKSKVCLNMLEHLSTLQEGGLDPFENVRLLIDYVEKYGNYISLFRKVQKGTREILILSYPMRILQKFVESIAVSISSFSDSEMLTHPKTKENMLRKHRAVESKIKTENLLVETSYSSCDATTWCQGLTSKVLFHFMCPFLPEELIRPVGRIMNLMTKKKLAIPKELMDRFANYLKAPEQRVMQDGLRRLYEGMALRECFTPGITHLVNRSNMGQGILHTPSSLAHDIALTGLFSYVRKLFRRENLHISHQVSSDDSGFIITLASKVETDKDILLFLLEAISNFIVSSYPLFSARTSDKSTVNCRNPIYEFNSVWQVSNFTAALAMKQIRACFAIRMTSFDRRIDELANNRRSLPNFGCSSQTVACVQIAQARCFYKAIGLFSQYSEVLRVVLRRMRHPVFGLFPFEPEKICGILGGGYALHKLLQRDPVSRRTQGLIYLHPSVSVKENGQPTLNIHFTPNSMTKFEAFNKKLRRHEDNLLPNGWRQEVSQKPDLLFDKYPKDSKSLLCSIFRKIDSKKMTESFVTDGVHQVLGSIAYLFTSACITVIEDGTYRKSSFLDLCSMDRQSDQTYVHRFEFMESYETADRVLRSLENTYEIVRQTRPAVRSSVKSVSQHEKLRNNLMTTALRYWSRTANDTIVNNFLQYTRKYTWLRTTFDETMRATGKDAVGLLDLISVRPDKETTHKALCERPKGPGLGDLLEVYASTPRPGVYIRSTLESIARFSEMRMDLNGAFTRLSLSLGAGPSAMPLEADSIIDSAYASLNSRGTVYTEEAMWRGVIDSTTNTQEKKFLLGLALFRKPDMLEELIAPIRDFSYYEEIGNSTNTDSGKIWGESVLFLKTQGKSFRVKTQGDTALLISANESALSFLRLPDNSERFCSHLKLLGIKAVLRAANGEFLTSLEEDEVMLNLRNFRIGQECPNYTSFKAPVKVTFGGYKCRVDLLPQTEKMQFVVRDSSGVGSSIIDAWVNNSQLNFSDFAKYPNYLRELYDCYFNRGTELEHQRLAREQVDMTDEEEVLDSLRSFIEGSSPALREAVAGKSLRELLMTKVDASDSFKLLEQANLDYDSEEDDGGFDEWTPEEVKEEQETERFAELSLRIDRDLLNELSRAADESNRNRELLNKMPRGMMDIFFRISVDLEAKETTSEVISLSFGLPLHTPVPKRAPARRFN
jgi:hypothetical protein